MSKADAEVIKMLLWLILGTLSSNPPTKAIAAFGACISAIAAIFATFAEVDA